jgi:hypothetical protein
MSTMFSASLVFASARLRLYHPSGTGGSAGDPGVASASLGGRVPGWWSE